MIISGVFFLATQIVWFKLEIFSLWVAPLFFGAIFLIARDKIYEKSAVYYAGFFFSIGLAIACGVGIIQLRGEVGLMLAPWNFPIPSESYIYTTSVGIGSLLAIPGAVFLFIKSSRAYTDGRIAQSTTQVDEMEEYGLEIDTKTIAGIVLLIGGIAGGIVFTEWFVTDGLGNLSTIYSFPAIVGGVPGMLACWHAATLGWCLSYPRKWMGVRTAIVLFVCANVIWLIAVLVGWLVF